MGFLSSTVGRKIIMAVTGFMLVAFLCIHFFGNSLIYFGWINAYGEKLHSMPAVVWIFRLVMLAIFSLHVWFGIKLTLENRDARPQAYAVKRDLKVTFAGKTMIWTGLIMVAFLIYHILHFTLRVTNPEISSGIDVSGRLDVFKMIVLSFSNVAIAGAYVAALIAMGLHMMHGIQSFVQTLGINSECSMPKMQKTATGIALILMLGYISIPVVIILGILAYKG